MRVRMGPAVLMGYVLPWCVFCPPAIAQPSTYQRLNSFVVQLVDFDLHGAQLAHKVPST